MTPWAVACQTPLFMEFSRQAYGNGLPFSSPGDLPDPGIEPTSLALAGGFFTTELRGNPMYIFIYVYMHIRNEKNEHGSIKPARGIRESYFLYCFIIIIF